MTPAPSERRRAPRALADFPIRLSPREGLAEAKLKDLSEIGLCCTTAAPLDEMTLVGIDLQLPGARTAMRVQGAVVRCERRRSSNDYELAVYFTEIGSDARSAIGAYVASAAPA